MVQMSLEKLMAVSARRAITPYVAKRSSPSQRAFSIRACPLINASHDAARAYRIISGQLLVEMDQGVTTLADSDQLRGYLGEASAPESLLIVNNGLHIEILIDRDSEIGSTDPAGIKDINLEAALTAIQDCEDSVAAVDAEDKVEVYRNWLGLMRGDLAESFAKHGSQLTRTLNPDREFPECVREHDYSAGQEPAANKKRRSPDAQ